MPFVVVITGIPGVGKSTITKLALKRPEPSLDSSILGI